jgi:hypothetical protein
MGPAHPFPDEQLQTVPPGQTIERSARQPRQPRSAGAGRQHSRDSREGERLRVLARDFGARMRALRLSAPGAHTPWLQDVVYDKRDRTLSFNVRRIPGADPLWMGSYPGCPDGRVVESGTPFRSPGFNVIQPPGAGGSCRSQGPPSPRASPAGARALRRPRRHPDQRSAGAMAASRSSGVRSFRSSSSCM